MPTRVFIILLMLVQVLACPFLDCGECTGACATKCVVADDACDDCCKSESDSAAAVCDPCDDPACPDNPGPLGCFCGGAVQADVVDCPDLLTGGEYLALPDATLTDNSSRLAAMSAELSIEGCPHFPPLITGTSICALTQTYLL